MNWLSTIAAVSLIGLGLIVHVTGTPVILEDPVSLLIPIDQVATFTCRALCSLQLCTGYWLINDSFSHTQITSEPRPDLVMKGFVFAAIRHEGEEYNLTLSVNNVSLDVNNTDVQCEFDASGSSERALTATATLLVIESSPLTKNPAIEKNGTEITLKWSPSFLWPGHHIQYFVLSIVNYSNGSSTLHRINSTYSDSVVFFILTQDENKILSILTCTEITFNISAFVASEMLPQSFNITDWILPQASTIVEMISSSIETSVFYREDRTPVVVEVTLQLLDSICPNQQLNYSLIIENREGGLLEQAGPIPFHPGSSGSIKQLIMSEKLKESQSYFLSLQVMIASQTFTSHKHQFNTTFISWTETAAVTTTTSNEEFILKVDRDEVFWYQLGTAVSLALTALMAIVILVTLCIICRRKRNDVRMKRLKRRVCNNNNMIRNPIYEGDGPLYEVVRPQRQTRAQEAALNMQSAACGGNKCESVQVDGDGGGQRVHLDINTELTDDLHDADTVRYVDHPIMMSRARSLSVDHGRSSESLHACCGPFPPRSQSISVPESRKMVVKKNNDSIIISSCQESLSTLSPIASGNTEEVTTDSQPSRTERSEITDGDGHYITMNPVRRVFTSL